MRKDPLSAEEVDGVFGSILTEIRQLGEREIASQLGEIVMRNLKESIKLHMLDLHLYIAISKISKNLQKKFPLFPKKNQKCQKRKNEDIDFMARAIELAKKGQLKTQPNPMVGCVIVKNKKIVGEGWHQEYGKDHAEINAIKNCKKRFGRKNALKIIAGSDFYVNLEPCSIEKILLHVLTRSLSIKSKVYFAVH